MGVIRLNDSENEVVITYETLFEMLRIEKSRPELQKLSKNYFQDILHYINEKLAIVQTESPQTSLFASAEKEKTRKELENIGRILKDIYDRREKKILDMAMIKSRIRSQIIDTSSMLDVEKALYQEISLHLKNYRTTNINKVLNGEMPVSVINNSSNNSQNDLSEQQNTTQIINSTFEKESVTAEMPEIPSATASERIPVSSDNPNIYKETESQSNNGTVAVRFLSAIEEIVGPDLEIYGPYKESATVNLPQELAKALINNAQAELCNQ